MRRTRLNVVPPSSKDVMVGNGLSGQVGMDEADGNNDLINVTPITPHTVSSVQNLVDATTHARESRTQRVRRLQEEAKALAREQIAELEVLLDATANMALEIADGGEAYSVGAREICRRLADELPRTLQTLKIVGKKG